MCPKHMQTENHSIADQFCRAFLTPADRSWATNELSTLGASAIPVLRSILSGEAKNEFDVPYRRLGAPLDCALVTIRLMGRSAKSLEILVRAELEAGHPYAFDALHAITDA
jgi:hypothetical protein